MTETFPSWRYGPDGEAAVFNSADDVPKGWKDHPPKPKDQEPVEQRPSRAFFQKEARRRGVPFSDSMSAAQLEKLLANAPEKTEKPEEVSQHGPPPEGPTHIVEEAAPEVPVPPDFAPPVEDAQRGQNLERAVEAEEKARKPGRPRKQ